MAKKTRREKHIHVHYTPEIKEFRRPVSIKSSVLTILASILSITLIIYLPVFQAGFVWDDVSYIRDNQLIRSIDIKSIFSNYVMGNYHPFTILAFSMEYQVFGLNETGYHVINLLLHLLNVVLVFYSVFLISNKTIVAFVAALLFGIHPLHTESVAWISELKDLLYTSFFLGAYIFYLKYLDGKRNRFYILSLLFFLFSLLSKAMAASLPLLLLLTDHFKNRKLDLKAWLEKVPFFILSVIFGVVAIFAQRSSEAIQDISIYSIPQRIVFACYGFITYLWKSFFPVSQSAFYPYPIKPGEDLDILFYVYPFLLLGLLALVFYSLRFTKKMMFGFGFFTITVLLVLQLIPVGQAVMADRYTYIPLIGIFYIAGEGLHWLWSNRTRTPAIAVLFLFTIFFSITTYSRNKVWKDGITLWTDVIKKFPHEALGYNNRGGIYLHENKNELALADLNKTIEMNPRYAEALNNRGVLLFSKKRNSEALNDLDRSIASRPDYAEAFSNRALILMELNRYPEALNDLNKAIAEKPGYAEAYYNRGLLYMNEGKHQQALNDYNKALDLKPGYSEAIINRGILLNEGSDSEKVLDDYKKAIADNPAEPRLYYNRGILLMKLERHVDAIADFTKTIALEPKNAKAYSSRGNALVKERDTAAALKDYAEAISVDARSAEAYLGRANIFRDQGNHDEALKDYDAAIGFDPSIVNAYYNRGILLIKEKRFEDVISDFSKVLELKGDSAMSYYNIGMAELLLKKPNEACEDLRLAANLGLRVAIDAHKQYCQ